MAILYTNGVFTRLSPAEFAGYSAIQYSASDPTHAVAIGFTTSGTVDFSAKLGAISANIDGWGGADKITSGSGEDSLWGDFGNDSLYGGDGNDLIVGDWNNTRTSGNDLLYGGAGNDNLIGGLGDNSLYGGDGNDVFYIGDAKAGRDDFFGGDGFDVVSVRNVFGLGVTSVAFNGLVLTAGTSIDLFVLDDANVHLTGTTSDDRIDLSGVKALTWNGSSYEERIEFDLKTGNDIYTGSLTSDLVHVTGGGATVNLGAGDDVLYFTGASVNAVNVLGGQGTDKLQFEGTAAVQFATLTLTVAASVEVLWGPDITLQGTSRANVFDLSGITAMNLGHAIALLGGNDLYTSGSARSVVEGGSGKDTLLGGAASDDLFGGTGVDSLVGGGGDDLYGVDTARDKVVEDAGQGYDTVQTTLASYRLGANVEYLVALAVSAFVGFGNDLDNQITGNSGQDTLRGFGGNDVLDGGSESDVLIGGSGDDVYMVDNASDVILEGADEGCDGVRVLLSAYTLGANIETMEHDGAGDFLGIGNALGNIIVGSQAGEGRDTLMGLEGNDSLFGGAGDDDLIGGLGADRMVGADGNDRYVGVDSTDQLVEDKAGGFDVIVSRMTRQVLAVNFEGLEADSDLGGVNYTGNAVANTIAGASGNDLLKGLEGNDTLTGHGGIDTLVGGEGDDDYYIDNDAAVVREFNNGGTDTVYSSAASTVYALNIEKLVLTSASGATGIGNARGNYIVGGAGADILDGRAGTDALDGGLGADTMIGGADDDSYWVDTVDDVIIETGKSGYDRAYVSASSFTIVTGLERVDVLWTTGTTITGNARANIVNAGEGGDTILSLGGADTLTGGLGADRLEGGAGDDVYMLVSAGDLVIEAADRGTDGVETWLDQYTLPDNVENLIYRGYASFVGIGNAGNNLLGAGNQQLTVSLEGLDGNDTLFSIGANGDTLTGGNDDDTYYLNSADYYAVAATVIEKETGGYDTVFSQYRNYTLAENVEKLVLQGDNINGTGNDLDNFIQGGPNTNIVSGGLGNDTLSGGAARDYFKFTDFASVDHVTDFAPRDGETILLDQAAFADLKQDGAGTQLRATEFKDLSLGNEDASDRILYDPTTGEVFYDADGWGGVAAVLFAVIDTKPTLTVEEFWLA